MALYSALKEASLIAGIIRILGTLSTLAPLYIDRSGPIVDTNPGTVIVFTVSESTYCSILKVSPDKSCILISQTSLLEIKHLEYIDLAKAVITSCTVDAPFTKS